MKRLTTYRHPSIADQIASGKGTKEEVEAILSKMIRDGAANSTIKRMKRVINIRFPKLRI